MMKKEVWYERYNIISLLLIFRLLKLSGGCRRLRVRLPSGSGGCFQGQSTCFAISSNLCNASFKFIERAYSS